MRHLFNVAAAVYFLTMVWMYRFHKGARADTWESPSGNLLVAMGFVDSDGEVLYQGEWKDMVNKDGSMRGA